jgi:guanylate kinase
MTAMGKFKIISISGPSNAGKDTIVNELYLRLQGEHPGKVYKSHYYTTRKVMRPGEVRDEYFLTSEEFDEKKQRGDFAFFGENDNYQVGTAKNECFKNEIVLVNIAAQFVEKLKELAKQNGGECFSIFVWADEEERVFRGQLRESWLFSEIPRYRIDHDIVKETAETAKGIDLIIENKEGKLEETTGEIATKVEYFINS